MFSRSHLRPFLASVCFLALALSACKPDYPKCKKDEHCAEHGEVCIEGLCKECGADKDCKEGFVCKENACVAPAQCRVDGDCGDAKRCRAGQCVPECTGDKECASGEKCQQNRCVSQAECVSSADCKGGLSCVESKCVEAADAGTGESAEEAARRKRLESCQLVRVQFDFNDFALSDSARQALDQDAECVKYKQKPVQIEGHCDERGTEEYNLVLGDKRANAVKRYLVGLGVDESKVKTISYGEERPVDQGHTEEAWAANRRAELSFR